MKGDQNTKVQTLKNLLKKLRTPWVCRLMI